MEIYINDQSEVTTVRLVGRLDTPASLEASQQLQGVIDNAGKQIVLDCKELSYISSSGLRIFLTIRKAASAAGGKVVVRGMNADIRQVFMMTGFLNLFEIEE